MPRHFLAPYKFVLEGCLKKELISAIKSLKNAYIDKNHCLRTKSINQSSRKIYGFVEYGDYGYNMDVIDIYKKTVTKQISQSESPLKKYFYLFQFTKSNCGYLILERIGNIGVRKILVEAINSRINVNGAKLNVEPLIIGIDKLLDNPIKEIEIVVPEYPKEIDARIEKKLGKNISKNVKKKILLVAKRNSRIPKTEQIEKIIQHLKNREYSKIGWIISEKEELNFTVQIGQSRRKINVKGGTVRSWFEISSDADRVKEAEKLLQIIKDELGDEF